MGIARLFAIGVLVSSLIPSVCLAEGLYGIPYKSIEQQPQSLKQYSGKAILIVNIATRCGYTPQLKGLESLYRKYEKQGLVVLGVPSNDFGEQTPEANGEVRSFCRLNYDVTFPLTEKMVIQGQTQHPLFKSLLINSKSRQGVKWNFEKFLVDKKGVLVKRFASRVKPLSSELTKEIEEILKK